MNNDRPSIMSPPHPRKPKKRIGVIFLTMYLIVSGTSVYSQETVTIGPTSIRSWKDLERIEAYSKAFYGTQRAIPSPMPSRQARSIAPPAADDTKRMLDDASISSAEQAPASSSSVTVPLIPASTTFGGVADNNLVIPPDTHGAVGPLHILTMLNSEVRIQDKTGGIISTISLTTFWTGGTGLSGTPFDPKVLYDALAGRWIAVCDANAQSTNSSVFFAISETNDPMGNWRYFSIDADPGDTSWADYPGVGFNSPWIVITNNMFSVSTGASKGAKMWVIDKQSALSGESLEVIIFPARFDLSAGVSGSTLQPCVSYSPTDTMYIVDNSRWYRQSDTTFLIRISQVAPSASGPVWSVIPGSIFPGTGLFPAPNNFNMIQTDAPQLGTSTLVETNDPRMLNAVYRNESIWCTHSGGLPPKIAPTPDRTAVFWYQLTPSSMPMPVVQSGTIDGGAGVHHMFPSIAANTAGDMCIGFSRSDATRYVEAVYAGRLASFPPNAVHPVQTFKTGESSYSKFYGGPKNRWGDFSATVVDPSDDMTFWTIQEYAGQKVGSGINSGRWGTWWAQIDPLVELPIQLAAFSATMTENGDVSLEWMTITEVNNFGFYLERRCEGELRFTEIPGSFIPGVGTTTEQQYYHFSDHTTRAGLYLYRLRQVDLNGDISYSHELAVHVEVVLHDASLEGSVTEFSLGENYPNPFNPTTSMRFSVPVRSIVSLEIFNTLGQRVAELADDIYDAGYHTVSWTADVPSGVYYARIHAAAAGKAQAQFTATRKLMLMR